MDSKYLQHVLFPETPLGSHNGQLSVCHRDEDGSRKWRTMFLHTGMYSTGKCTLWFGGFFPEICLSFHAFQSFLWEVALACVCWRVTAARSHGNVKGKAVRMMYSWCPWRWDLSFRCWPSPNASNEGWWSSSQSGKTNQTMGILFRCAFVHLWVLSVINSTSVSEVGYRGQAALNGLFHSSVCFHEAVVSFLANDAN